MKNQKNNKKDNSQKREWESPQIINLDTEDTGGKLVNYPSETSVHSS